MGVIKPRELHFYRAATHLASRPCCQTTRRTCTPKMRAGITTFYARFPLLCSHIISYLACWPCKRSSTCSLPDEPYIFLIYGHNIHDSRMYERYRIYIWYWEMSVFCWMVVCGQNVSHPAGNMPSTVCLVLGWFWWGTPFISVLFWSSFCPWFVGGFWPILTHYVRRRQ